MNAVRRLAAGFHIPLCVLAALWLLGPAPCLAAAEGDRLPAITLPDAATEKPVDLGAVFQGSVGAISYMQTSCAACRQELLALKDLRGKYPELKVVAISVDSGNPARVARYREHFGFDFPFVHDPDFKTPELFGFSFTPALVLVAKDGTIGLLKGGYRPGDEVELEKKILELTGKP
jgi:peroxiredoxin